MKSQLVVCQAFVGLVGCGGNGGGPVSPTDDDQGDTDLADTDTSDSDNTDDDGDSATGQFTRGSTRCGGFEDLEIETCQPNGTWTITALCPYVCYGGQCSCECGPGSQRCCTGYASGDKNCGNQYMSVCIGSALRPGQPSGLGLHRDLQPQRHIPDDLELRFLRRHDRPHDLRVRHVQLRGRCQVRGARLRYGLSVDRRTRVKVT